MSCNPGAGRDEASRGNVMLTQQPKRTRDDHAPMREAGGSSAWSQPWYADQRVAQADAAVQDAFYTFDDGYETYTEGLATARTLLATVQALVAALEAGATQALAD